MRIVIGQFAVARSWEDNLARCLDLVEKARARGAGMLVLPEGVLARDPQDPDHVLSTAQSETGPFMTALLHASKALAIVFCVNVPDGAGRFFNTLYCLRDGEITVRYRKLHLYDAFSMQESRLIAPGNSLPPVYDFGGVRCGFLTCYDVRFPEIARHLAVSGAEVLIVPAAWLRGPGKERHWEVMLAARALENTCYVIGAGECGSQNIGHSMVIDPLGTVIAAAGIEETALEVDIDLGRVARAKAVLPVLANRRFADPVLSGSEPR
ncbi:deaminated glutathione amidase [Swaminathania salitolerans]|uniref:Hydrolase n=1 Tax=Swaminathania salitolerans TaxID=182838 RepID=A0A511BLJ0_9PROT|nr:deaminated glutathione amidase [Swaminathania salitolerans]GBQ10206.1 hydrolase [Swaminathania salitolerans LMG 21291]GEL01209.1 hydrolase [Swaminathania salitolerans]